MLLLFLTTTYIHGEVSDSTDQPQKARLNILPTSIVLHSAEARQGVTVIYQQADGSTIELLGKAEFQIVDPSVAVIDQGQISPKSNGATTLVVSYDNQRQEVPITVQGYDTEHRLTFRNDVLPVLTRAGCNTGKCHGAASGKDGFRLSLFGYDPTGDHYRLTREMAGRRIELSEPEECLLVQKAIGGVPHTGGKRIAVGSDGYKTLVNWLADGAVEDPDNTPEPIRIEVFPPEMVFATKGEKLQLVVQAHYSDGSSRDVTDLAVFLSNNDAVASVNEDGHVEGNNPGGAFILARFDKFTEGTSIITRSGQPYATPDFAPNNYIDELTLDRWKQLHIIPSSVCSDEVFLRRVTLDLIGQLPTRQEMEDFVRDSDPLKREKLVDRLVVRPEFLDLWVMKWAEMLQIRSINGVSPKGLRLYDLWLRDKVKSGATIDKIIAELVPASGGTFDNPASAYYQTETTPQLLAENLAQSFLGTRIQCAQCHNHPFDRWTMDDYYGFAAFFSQVGYKQAKDPREVLIYNAGVGDLRHPLDDRPVSPKFLGGELPKLDAGSDYRSALAGWLSSNDNPAFSKHIANVVWAQYFGIGIVEPVDDVRISNPASNRDLLNGLAKKLVEYEFDLRKLVRDICLSKTYQLSTQTNPTNALDERNFSHGRIRRLRAEILLDCINQVTETTEDFEGLLPGEKAIQIPGGASDNYFLTTFGRASRNTACSCEVMTNPTLSQALHLLNGETTSGKIVEGALVSKALKEGKTASAIIDEIYVRCLTRLPTPTEKAAIEQRIQNADLGQELTDLFWAVLNSNEFIFNH